jgi:hypothetical protein
MPIYFILLDAKTFYGRIVPPLTAAWRQRSFAPCRPLCADLLPTLAEFRANCFAGAEEPLLAQVERGLPFDRRIWRALVGEVLLFAAVAVPELQTAPETLCWLLAREHYSQDVPRERFAPIQQAHYGTRDLTFGSAVHRPDQVGLNDAADVERLAEYLSTVEPQKWSAADLAGLCDLADDEERNEELEFVREWFPSLRNLYQQAHDRGLIVVCEVY